METQRQKVERAAVWLTFGILVLALVAGFGLAAKGTTPQTGQCTETVTEYRVVKEIKKNGEWKTASGAVAYDSGWQVAGHESLTITNRPGGPWELETPQKIGGDWYRYHQTSKDVQVEVECEEEVDFCDPSNKPPGSIAKWLTDNGFDGADCFEITASQVCGSATVTVTEFPVFPAGPYVAVWLPGDVDPALPANTFPASFTEDEGGGSVTITWFLVGPEEDYLVGTDIPNFWDGNGETMTVLTDCEEDTTTTTVAETTTTTQEETTTTVAETTTTVQETTTTTEEETTTTDPDDPSTTVTTLPPPPPPSDPPSELPYTGFDPMMLAELGLTALLVGGFVLRKAGVLPE